MGDETFKFFNAKQVLELGWQALQIFDETNEYGLLGGRRDPRGEAANRAAHAMLVACAECIAQVPNPSLWPLAMEIIDRLPGDASLWRQWDANGTGSLKGFAEAGLRLEELEALAGDPRAHVRLAVAEVFPVEKPKQLAVVSALVADEDARVSAAARKRLEGVELPFWVGKFSADPFAGLTAEETAAARQPIEKLCELFEKTYWDTPDQRVFLQTARRLPPRLELDVLTRAARGERLPEIGDASPVEARLAQLGDAGAEAMLQLFASSQRHVYSRTRSATAYGKALAPGDARRILPRWLERLRAMPTSDDERGSLVHCFAAAIGAGWPTHDDPRPVLDAALERPAMDTFDFVLGELAEVIRRSTRHDLLAPRIEPALREGFPHRWRAIANSCRELLEKMPKQALRELAERTLDCANEPTLAWACGVLLNEAFDARRDGTRARRAVQLDRDPGTRRTMRVHHTIAVLPTLRAELARGALDFELAGYTMKAIGELYGGTFVYADRAVVLGTGLLEDEPVGLPDGRGLEKFDRVRQRPFLGPSKLRRPPSPDEWHAWRTLRAERAISGERDLELGLFGVEFDPGWHPADRAYFERATAHLRSSPGPRAEWLAAAAMGILAIKGSGRDLPLMRELRRVGARHEDIVGERLERVLAHFRTRFELRAVTST